MPMTEHTETGYIESCCWTYERQYCPGPKCACRCHAAMPVRAVGRDRQTLLWIADDLRRAAEAHLKSVGITGKRIERKHLTEIADVLIERARFYEMTAAASGPRADDGGGV